MQCPIDQTVLVRFERQGVEIDHCPTCRGVWLDRGELDKIIDRSTDRGPSRPESRPTEVTRSEDTREKKGRTGRRSFLADIFDF